MLAWKLCRWNHLFFTEPISRVLFVYSYEQPWFSTFAKELSQMSIEVQFYKDTIPELTLQKHSCLIIDDLKESMLPEVSELFIRNARHTKTTIIICFQNLFLNNSYFRIVSANTNLIFLFYLSRSTHQIRNLAYQLFGNKTDTQDFVNLYNDVMKRKYSYLLIDCRPARRFKIRHNIFPDEKLESVFECQNERSRAVGSIGRSNSKSKTS